MGPAAKLISSRGIDLVSDAKMETIDSTATEIVCKVVHNSAKQLKERFSS